MGIWDRSTAYYACCCTRRLFWCPVCCGVAPVMLTAGDMQEAETVLSDARKLLRIEDSVHEVRFPSIQVHASDACCAAVRSCHNSGCLVQALTREVSRDPEIKALRAGKLPNAINHGHTAAMGGILTDSAGAIPMNGMGMVSGAMAPPTHGHVHTVDRGRRPQPKAGDKRTSQGMHGGFAPPCVL